MLAFVGHHCNCNELIAEECVQDNGAISGTVPLCQMVLHGWFCSLQSGEALHTTVPYMLPHDHNDIRGWSRSATLLLVCRTLLCCLSDKKNRKNTEKKYCFYQIYIIFNPLVHISNNLLVLFFFLVHVLFIFSETKFWGWHQFCKTIWVCPVLIKVERDCFNPVLPASLDFQ